MINHHLIKVLLCSEITNKLLRVNVLQGNCCIGNAYYNKYNIYNIYGIYTIYIHTHMYIVILFINVHG